MQLNFHARLNLKSKLRLSSRHFSYSNPWTSDTLKKKAIYLSPPSTTYHICLQCILYFSTFTQFANEAPATFMVRFWNLIFGSSDWTFKEEVMYKHSSICKGPMGWLGNIQYWNCFKDIVWGPVGNVHSHNLIIACQSWFHCQRVLRIGLSKSMPASRSWNTRLNWGKSEADTESQVTEEDLPLKTLLRTRRHILPLAKNRKRPPHVSWTHYWFQEILFQTCALEETFTKRPASIWCQGVWVYLWFACVCMLVLWCVQVYVWGWGVNTWRSWKLTSGVFFSHSSPYIKAGSFTWTQNLPLQLV